MTTTKTAPTMTHVDVMVAVLDEIDQKHPGYSGRILKGLDESNPHRDQWVDRVSRLCAAYVIGNNVTLEAGSNHG